MFSLSYSPWCNSLPVAIASVAGQPGPAPPRVIGAGPQVNHGGAAQFKFVGVTAKHQRLVALVYCSYSPKKMDLEVALLLLSTFTGLYSFTNSNILTLNNFTLCSHLYILVFHLEVNSQQCSRPIGTNNEVEHSAVRANRFYLNTAAPAPCSGTITEVRVCYYKPNNIRNLRVYYVTVAVYREMSDDPGQYQRISDTFVTISYTGTQIRDENGNFVCNIFDVSPDLDIEAGDVFGACVFNPSGIRPRRLEIVGEASGSSLMEMSSSGCSLTSIPSTISTSDLSNVNSRILHVYANITSK